MPDDSSEIVSKARGYLARSRVLACLLRMAIWSTRNVQDAEDLVGETIARVLEPRDPRWDGVRAFLSFMSFALRHVFAQWQRRLSWQETPHDPGVLSETAQSKGPLPDEQVDRARSVRDLDAKCEMLKTDLGLEDDRLRQCFVLWVDGASIQEQADATGLSPAEVSEAHRTILRRAESVRERWFAQQEELLRQRRQGKPAPREVHP